MVPCLLLSIPWSLVSHDLIWNLLPADSSINSSKSDKLPKLDIYLPKFAAIQQKAIKIVLSKGYTNPITESYINLGCSLQELADMDEEHLNDCFLRTYSPLQQIALNMGFLKPDGKAYFAVRRDLTYEGFRMHFIYHQYTYQCTVRLPFKSLIANKSFEVYEYSAQNHIGDNHAGGYTTRPYRSV